MSDKPKITKGDWTILDMTREGISRINIISRQDSERPVCVARVENRVNDTPITDEDRANALMMAASPKLYRSLKTLLDYCELHEDSEEVQEALRAIDEAEQGDVFARSHMKLS